jgi:hypothetical protein
VDLASQEINIAWAKRVGDQSVWELYCRVGPHPRSLPVGEGTKRHWTLDLRLFTQHFSHQIDPFVFYALALLLSTL